MLFRYHNNLNYTLTKHGREYFDYLSRNKIELLWENADLMQLQTYDVEPTTGEKVLKWTEKFSTFHKTYDGDPNYNYIAQQKDRDEVRKEYAKKVNSDIKVLDPCIDLRESEIFLELYENLTKLALDVCPLFSSLSFIPYRTIEDDGFLITLEMSYRYDGKPVARGKCQVFVPLWDDEEEMVQSRLIKERIYDFFSEIDHILENFSSPVKSFRAIELYGEESFEESLNDFVG